MTIDQDWGNVLSKDILSRVIVSHIGISLMTAGIKQYDTGMTYYHSQSYTVMTFRILLGVVSLCVHRTK